VHEERRDEICIKFGKNGKVISPRNTRSHSISKYKYKGKWNAKYVGILENI